MLHCMLSVVFSRVVLCMIDKTLFVKHFLILCELFWFSCCSAYVTDIYIHECSLCKTMYYMDMHTVHSIFYNMQIYILYSYSSFYLFTRNILYDTCSVCMIVYMFHILYIYTIHMYVYTAFIHFM